MISNLREFDGKRLQSVAQGTADLGPLEDQAEAEAKEQASTVLSGLISQLKAVLADQAWDVRVTSRLTTSPACIVANEPETENSLAHRLRGSGLPIQPVLEINPQHPLVQRLNREPADPRLAEWANILYNQAVLTLGARIEDPAAFVARMNDLLVSLTDQTDGVGPQDERDEIAMPEPPDTGNETAEPEPQDAMSCP
jgi:molecular chaperone HtpG